MRCVGLVRFIKEDYHNTLDIVGLAFKQSVGNQVSVSPAQTIFGLALTIGEVVINAIDAGDSHAADCGILVHVTQFNLLLQEQRSHRTVILVERNVLGTGELRSVLLINLIFG